MEINPAVILALLADLYQQLAAFRDEAMRLKTENETLKEAIRRGSPPTETAP